MRRFAVLAIAAVVVLLPAGSAAADKMTDPHWTDNPCREFSIDIGSLHDLTAEAINAACNKCHAPGSEYGSEPHPVGKPVPQDILPRVPQGWPLTQGKITCLTCHDVGLKLNDSVITRVFNVNFLRTPPAGARSFCFVCHDSRRYEQPNPHKNMIVSGVIQEAACLKCHRDVPDRTAGHRAPLKQDSDLLCIGCHSRQVRRHPARSDHMLKMPAKMKEALPAADGTEPLLHLGRYDEIHCITCHNPHEKGVITARRCAAGAGEASLLRLPGRYELCVYCHGGLKVDRDRLRRAPERYIMKTPARPMTAHKPWAEKKCKACHRVTPGQRDKPPAVSLCFGRGCHETKLVEHRYRHDLSVLRNCYFCHESHGAEYPKLLRSNEERICHTCHPLLREKGGTTPRLRDPLAVHQQFFDYQMNLGVETDNTCNFCHSSRHWALISRIDTGACADCHLKMRSILTRETKTALNRHTTYTDRTCSACHGAHGADHEMLLKKPPEHYREVTAP